MFRWESIIDGPVGTFIDIQIMNITFEPEAPALLDNGYARAMLYCPRSAKNLMQGPWGSEQREDTPPERFCQVFLKNLPG